MANWYDVVNLDRRFLLTGSYSAGTGLTTWTLPGTVVDTTLTTAVLGLDFGSAVGDIITITSAGGTPSTYTAVGSYGAGTAVLGRSYTTSLELSKPYVRDRNGLADLDGRIRITKLIANLHNTGEANIRWTYPNRAARTRTLDVDPIVERGTLIAWPGGDADNMTVYVEAYGPKPFTLSAFEWEGIYQPRIN